RPLLARGRLVKGSERQLLRREVCAARVELRVLARERLTKGAMRVGTLPAVDGEEAQRVAAVAQQQRAEIARRLAEERVPGAGRSVFALELLDVRRADQELPQVGVSGHGITFRAPGICVWSRQYARAPRTRPDRPLCERAGGCRRA